MTGRPWSLPRMSGPLGSAHSCPLRVSHAPPPNTWAMLGCFRGVSPPLVIRHFLCGQGGRLRGQVPGSSILSGLGGDRSGSVFRRPADPGTRESTAPWSLRLLFSQPQMLPGGPIGSERKSHNPGLPSGCASWIPDTDGEPLTPPLHVPHCFLFF